MRTKNFTDGPTVMVAVTVTPLAIGTEGSDLSNLDHWIIGSASVALFAELGFFRRNPEFQRQIAMTKEG
jgi:hypothetical protein